MSTYTVIINSISIWWSTLTVKMKIQFGDFCLKNKQTTKNTEETKRTGKEVESDISLLATFRFSRKKQAKKNARLVPG